MIDSNLKLGLGFPMLLRKSPAAGRRFPKHHPTTVSFFFLSMLLVLADLSSSLARSQKTKMSNYASLISTVIADLPLPNTIQILLFGKIKFLLNIMLTVVNGTPTEFASFSFVLVKTFGGYIYRILCHIVLWKNCFFFFNLYLTYLYCNLMIFLTYA